MVQAAGAWTANNQMNYITDYADVPLGVSCSTTRLMRSEFGLTHMAIRTGVVAATLGALAVAGVAPAHADNKRLNNGVVANVYTIKRQAGCTNDIKVNPKLRLAAQWQTDDVLSNRSLDGDIGSDGSTVADRAHNAGYSGFVAETVAINPALAITGIDILHQWYYRPDYYAIMSECANVDIGVWSENSLGRTVVVAVYGKGDSAPPANTPGVRPFGQP